MRELKFRAWDKVKNKMLFDADPFALHVSGSNEPLLAETHKNENCIFEQYTGLKDKNGKEIYEGDIVKGGRLYGKNWQVVKYQNYGFYPFIVTDFDGDSMVRSVDIAVVGNIHENPELLEEEE